MATVRTLDRYLRPYAELLLEAARQAGIQVVVTSARRSRATQARLYRAYMQGRSRFPAAPPGTSMHERGLAFDLGTTPASALTDLGRLWEEWGGKWGGKQDPVHFQAP